MRPFTTTMRKRFPFEPSTQTVSAYLSALRRNIFAQIQSAVYKACNGNTPSITVSDPFITSWPSLSITTWSYGKRPGMHAEERMNCCSESTLMSSMSFLVTSSPSSLAISMLFVYGLPIKWSSWVNGPQSGAKYCEISTRLSSMEDCLNSIQRHSVRVSLKHIQPQR